MIDRQIIGGRYRLEAELGSGGMGTVYKGTDLHNGQPVAVKVLKEQVIAAEPTLMARFEREAEALRLLNHPNIVKILASISENNSHYLVMEYVGGGSLVDLLRNGSPLAIRQLLRIAVGLADALAQTHHLGIIHRDFKPANILLTEGGTPRLTDFGVAHTSNSNLTKTGTVMGTLAYLCPEAFQAEELDQRADIWSFGVTLYEMLTGSHLFSGDQVVEVMQAVLTQPIPDLEKRRPDAPVALVDLVYRMLEKDPMLRIPAAKYVGAELEAVLRTLPATSPDLRIAAYLAASLEYKTDRFDVLPKRGERLNLSPTPGFAGRERELNDLSAMLAASATPLVTVTGPEGTGKTRLVLECARQQAPHFADGVFFVPVGGLPHASFIIPAIASVLGLTLETTINHDPRVSLKQHIWRFLTGKTLLLILDDVKPTAETDAVLKALLSRLGSRAKLLVTAREPLKLRRESVYAIGGLSFHQWKKPKIALEYAVARWFMYRANEVVPGWELGPDDVTPLYRICDACGGSPLVLMLAAGCLEQMSLGQIAARFQQNLEFVGENTPRLSAEEQALRAMLEVMRERLEPAEWEALVKMAVFQGGFMREAAQEVTSIALRSLITLVRRSVLQRDPLGRFALHPALQRLLHDQLASQQPLYEMARQRHSNHYLDLLRKRKYDLQGANQRSALYEIGRELGNVAAAWTWATAKRHDAALAQIVDPLCIYLILLNDGDTAVSLLKPTIEAFRGKNLVWWTRLLVHYAGFLMLVGHNNDARAALRESEDYVEDHIHEAAWALYYDGRLQLKASKGKRGDDLLHMSLMLSHQVNDKFLRLRVLNAFSQAVAQQGDQAGFAELHEAALVLARETHDEFGEQAALALATRLAT